MKSILVVLGLSLTLLACDQLKSSKDDNVKKVSYAIGRDLGQNFKMQQLPVDPSMIAKGIQDSMDGKDEKYSQEEVQEAMKVIREKKESEAKEQAKENIEKAKRIKYTNPIFLMRSRKYWRVDNIPARRAGKFWEKK